MKDEIKEIITRINKEIEKHIKEGYSEDMLVIYELDVLQWRILLDYITNLQQRCEYLERSNNRREDTIIWLRFEVAEQEDYKSRCEKAKDKLRRDYYTNYTQHNDDVVREAINILQNGSEEK